MRKVGVPFVSFQAQNMYVIACLNYPISKSLCIHVCDCLYDSVLQLPS